jgi:hypothetical protein
MLHTHLCHNTAIIWRTSERNLWTVKQGGALSYIRETWRESDPVLCLILRGLGYMFVSLLFKHTFLLIQRNLCHYVSACNKEYALRFSFMLTSRRTLLWEILTPQVTAVWHPTELSGCSNNRTIRVTPAQVQGLPISTAYPLPAVAPVPLRLLPGNCLWMGIWNSWSKPRTLTPGPTSEDQSVTQWRWMHCGYP